MSQNDPSATISIIALIISGLALACAIISSFFSIRIAHKSLLSNEEKRKDESLPILKRVPELDIKTDGHYKMVLKNTGKGDLHSFKIKRNAEKHSRNLMLSYSPGIFNGVQHFSLGIGFDVKSDNDNYTLEYNYKDRFERNFKAIHHIRLSEGSIPCTYAIEAPKEVKTAKLRLPLFTKKKE